MQHPSMKKGVPSINLSDLFSSFYGFFDVFVDFLEGSQSEPVGALWNSEIRGNVESVSPTFRWIREIRSWIRKCDISGRLCSL